MIFTSPYPDIEIPSIALTDFVLEHSAEYGDKPALIDGATGRTYTHAQTADAIATAAGGLAAPRHRPGRRRRALRRPTRPST